MRKDSKVFHIAKNDEIRGLIERIPWSVVHVQSLPLGADIIGGRFGNVLKNAGTEKELAKERYVAQGYNDKMKLFVVHNNTTALRQSSSKTIVCSACILNFRISLLDVTQAYLQSEQKMYRVICCTLSKRTKTGNVSWWVVTITFDSISHPTVCATQEITEELHLMEIDEDDADDRRFFIIYQANRLQNNQNVRKLLR